MCFVNNNTGWVCGSDTTILKTTDSGNSWLPQNVESIFMRYSVFTVFHSIQFTDENNGWAVGQGGVMIRTTNGGTNWILQQEPMSKFFRSVFFLDDKTGWLVGNGGAILSTKTAGEVTTTVLDNKYNIPNTFSLSQNYPNPFNPTTKIEYTIPTSPQTPLFNKERGRGEVIILKIYDILGREIKTLVNKQQPPGNYEVTFDGSEFASGVYFYRLQVGNYSQTKKLILLK